MRVEKIIEANELEKWLLFLKSDKETKEALAVESSTMKEAFQEIERLSQNPETRRLADYREQELKNILQRELDAREDGIIVGIEKGIEKGKQEIIINMYMEGMTVQDIAKLTKVTLETVLEIIWEVES